MDFLNMQTMEDKSKNKVNQRYNMIKKYHTNTLLKAISEKKADEKIIPFLLKIIDIPDIFTSSSCAGRLMLLSTDNTENKKNSSFYKKYHRLVTFDEVYNDISSFSGDELWLKVESFIFHFGVKDYLKAKELLQFAQSYGLKKAGIISAKDGKYILEMSYTQYMSLPVVMNNILLFSKDYLKILIEKGNSKLQQNYTELKIFENEFLKRFI
jgi:tRNA wybutosine-synthesizing protein 3